MSEARRENTTLRILAFELFRALISRRYKKTHLMDSYQPPNTRVDSIYIAVRKALTHSANVTWRKVTQLDQDFCISKPRWELTEEKGPLDKWNAEWVTPGLFTRHKGKII